MNSEISFKLNRIIGRNKQHLENEKIGDSVIDGMENYRPLKKNIYLTNMTGMHSI